MNNKKNVFTKINKLFLISISFVFLTSVVLVSCQKEELENVKAKAPIDMTLDNIPVIKTSYTAKHFIKNPKDADDEKINGYLLDIAVATRDLLREKSTDASINGNILKSANESANSCVNLFDLVKNSKLKSTTLAYSNFVNALNKADLTHKSQNPLKAGKIEEYIPAIHVVNIDIADMSKQPIICPGFEVDNNLSDIEEYEDYIVGWYYDDKGNLCETLISEETAKNTTNPIFIIVNAEKEGEINNIKAEIKQGNTHVTPQLKLTQGGIIPYITKYKITKRYDRSRKSEYHREYVIIYTNASVQNGGYSSLIRKIDKKDIGKLFTDNHQIPMVSDVAGLWIVTFEHDWYVTRKKNVRISDGPLTQFVQCRMKYSNEWYQRFFLSFSVDRFSKNENGTIMIEMR